MKSFLELFRGPGGRSYAFPFALVCTLFFLWGFCNGLIDILNKHFQSALNISKAESAWVQCANFSGYLVMAIPAGILARRYGYKGGILIGLAIIAAGALWFLPATRIGTFPAFLGGLFILAQGLAILETIANPYATVLGPPRFGAARINLAQVCNAVGTFLGPLIGSQFVLSATGTASSSNATLYIPYLGIAGLVVVLTVCFVFAELPDIAAEEEAPAGAPSAAGPARVKPLWRRWHFTLAVVAQFLYVAAQIGVWSSYVNYLTSGETPGFGAGFAAWFPANMIYAEGAQFHFTEQGAGILLSLGGFGLFILGRLAGSALLRVLSAHVALALFGVVNTVLMVLIVARLGWVSVGALFLSSFFMSIMYPTIFALGIRGLGEATKLASSLIVMAIAGGAVMPIVMGWLADVSHSMSIGFLMPLGCFAFVTVYAAAWPALERHDSGHEVAD
ncbi:MAG: L-fucose:H+ symporter permease [Verrucomicrobiota bacterium]